MSTTAQTIITGALRLIGVIDPEETPTAAMAIDGLRRLQMMVGQWSIQVLTATTTSREVFALVANQASYTIGPGGNFNTIRPAKILGAGLMLGTTGVEIPRVVYTTEDYAAISMKAMASSLVTGIVYDPTYPAGLGTVTPWPVPNTTANSLVLYRDVPLPLFVSLTGSYDLPEGADEPLEYNLAVRLAATYTVPIPPDVRQIAKSSLTTFKANNVRLVDRQPDPLVSWGVGGYNIETGE